MTRRRTTQVHISAPSSHPDRVVLRGAERARLEPLDSPEARAAMARHDLAAARLRDTLLD